MADNNMYSFEIFGNTYKLQTSDGQRDTLVAVVNYYKKTVEQLNQTYPNKSQTEILVLAGVTISDRLYSTTKFYENRTPPSEKANNEFLSESIKKLGENL